jgi:tripartite-type tricarboxylate transporter receptor subunit TctC
MTVERCSGLLAAVLVCAPHIAWAQPAAGEGVFPSRPLRIIVPFHPGGTPDVQIRLMQERLAQRLGQPVVIDNRGGANGIIGMEIAARAAPDGYTVTYATVGAWTVHPFLIKLPYDVLKDFTAVIHTAVTPGVLVVHPSVQAKTVKELIALAKEKPGQLSYGSAGIGGWFQIATELFAYMANIKLLHVPYKGAAFALTDVMGGQVQMMVNTTIVAAPHIRSARVRALATTGAQRSHTLPDIPTLDEAGVRGYEGNTWCGLGAPARTPRHIVERINRDIAAVMQTPEVHQKLMDGGSQVTGGPPDAFLQILKSDLEKYGRLIKAVGIKGS